jgi:hypothetical protein
VANLNIIPHALGCLTAHTDRTEGFGNSADKAILFEFSMPHDNATTGLAPDTPAIWMLNARIPYTGQYSSCNCWSSGCGEVDFFEALSQGTEKCKATVHVNPWGGGGDDYFARPIDKPIKAGMLFHAATNSIIMKVLPDSTQFEENMSVAQIQNLLSSESLIEGGLTGSFARTFS